MRIDIVTIFPDMIRGALGYSIVWRAQQDELVAINVVDLRDFTADKRRTVDLPPFGGGAGMVLKPEPVFDAVESLDASGARIVLLTPQGRPLTQAVAHELAAESHLVLICGHYEGFDERIREHLATDEISVGDYVLTGGELPALVLTDCVTRLLPGVLGNAGSLGAESFDSDLLEYPQYTRPAVYRGWEVPSVLLSGHHAEVAKWRRAQQELRTKERRPDLWARHLESRPPEPPGRKKRKRSAGLESVAAKSGQDDSAGAGQTISPSANDLFPPLAEQNSSEVQETS